MENNKNLAFDVVGDGFKNFNIMMRAEQLTVFSTIHLQNRIAELEKELVVTKFQLSERQKVLDAIPGCPLHGKNCVPHALDWIEEKINQPGINANIENSKTSARPITEKSPRKSYVQNLAETYKVSMNIIRKVMRDKGRNGRYAKSRNIVYHALCELGYIIPNKLGIE